MTMMSGEPRFLRALDLVWMALFGAGYFPKSNRTGGVLLDRVYSDRLWMRGYPPTDIGFFSQASRV